MYILIVEDDKIQYQFISNALRASKAVDVKRIERICTEKEFLDRFEEIAADKPDAIMMDIMLRWTDPAPDMVQPPPDVVEEGFYRAGFRCDSKLAADPRTNHIPVIIYSVLESSDLDEALGLRPGVKFLEKNFDARAIERVLREHLKR